MNKEYEVAQVSRRIGAFIIDFLFVFLIWYLLTKSDLNKVDNLLKTLDPDVLGSAEVFQESIVKMYVAFFFKFLFSQALYYTLIPAIIGRGKTIGRLLFGISMVDEFDLKEIPATRLILREVVGRVFIETLFVIPSIVSVIMMIKNPKGQTVHDKIAKTVMIKDGTFIYPEGDE